MLKREYCRNYNPLFFFKEPPAIGSSLCDI
jgi:hypothetical protein